MTDKEKLMATDWNDQGVCRSYLKHHNARQNPDQDRSISLISDDISSQGSASAICDVGCGGGEFSIKLVQAEPRLTQVFNVEPSRPLREVAEDNVVAAGLMNKVAFVDSLSNLGVGTIRVCTLHRVINNVQENGINDIFKDVSRVLSQDGLLFASIFAQESLTPAQRAGRINVFDAQGNSVNGVDLENGMIVMPKSNASVTHGIVNYFYYLDYVAAIAEKHGLHPVDVKTLESVDAQGQRRTPVHHVVYSL